MSRHANRVTIAECRFKMCSTLRYANGSRPRNVGLVDTDELLIRESIRDTIARYNHAGDRGKYQDMIECFHDDGQLQIVDGETLHGHDALRTFFSTVRGNTATPESLTMLRHCVTNTLIEVLTPTTATANSYFQVLTNVGLDHWGRYRDTFSPDPESKRWLIQTRSVKTDAYAPTSLFNH